MLALRLLAGLSVAATPVFAADPALLVDISRADAADVAAWRGHAGVTWWLELGDQLLLAGDTAAIEAAIGTRAARQPLGALAPEDLVLHARGCAAAAAPADLLVWAGSRYDLLYKPDAARMAAFAHVHADHLGAPEWLSVEPNQVIARQYRLEQPDGAVADPLIVPLVTAVDVERWYAGVETLAGWSRSTFSAELPLARAWIAGQFSALGLTVTEPAFTFNFAGGSHSANNVIGRLEGARRPDEWVIVGGHYDARNANISSPVNAPGADDNATGCSAVVEAARIFSRFRPDTSMLFVCYAGEEQGLLGSTAHANALAAAGDLGKVKAMANMDMIGWSANAQIGVDLDSSNTALRQRFGDAAAAYVPELAVTISLLNCCSDHMPYLNRGVPAIMSLHKNYGSYVHYHQSTDVPANLGPFSRAVGGAIVRMNVAALAGLTGASDRLFADAWETARHPAH